MNRRLSFLIVAAIVLVALVGVEAQSSGMPRIGVVAAPSAESLMGAGFFQGLSDLGYTNGRNVIIEWRSSGGNADVLCPSHAHCGVRGEATAAGDRAVAMVSRGGWSYVLRDQ